MRWELARAGRGTGEGRDGTGRGGAGLASKGYRFFKP